jgi:hypothetical protein
VTKGRGVPQFAIFDAFQVDYIVTQGPARRSETFSRIIEWFVKRNAQALGKQGSPR